MLFVLEGFDENWFNDSVDYAVLGYLIGEIVVNRVPVIVGMPERTMPDDLKAFSAAAASGGAVALFHVVGQTPEAPTLEAAFGGRIDYEKRIITPDDMRAMQKRLDTAQGEDVDFVLMGCPHLSARELARVAELIRGRKVKDGVDFWIMTSETQYNLALRSGDARIIEESGAVITRDTCLMEMDEGVGRWKGLNFVTNSGKAAQYAPAINGVKIKMADTAGCVEAAVTGRMSWEAKR